MTYNQTSLSLLERLRHAPGGSDWEQLVAAYLPLLRNWLTRYQVQSADAEDLAQDVLLVVMQELPSFRHNQQTGAFRTWLRRILVNRLRNFWRLQGRRCELGGGDALSQQLSELEDPHSAHSLLWDREHDRHLALQLLALLDARFTPSTRTAFRRLVLEGAPADVVAAELGLSLNAVFTAKSRVLRELRTIGKGLLD
jgi:RNA polymerase sigma factor (sigma-70 family)